MLALTLRRVREDERDLMVVCRQGPTRTVLAASDLENRLTERDQVPTAEDSTPRQAAYRR